MELTAASPSATAVPSPTPTPDTDPAAAAGGLIIITIAAVGGYQLARWLRRARWPRPRGPWFGGRESPP